MLIGYSRVSADEQLLGLELDARVDEATLVAGDDQGREGK